VILKPQDVLVCLKHVVAHERSSLSYGHLATELGISASEAHASTKRAIQAHLLVRRDDRVVPSRRILYHLLVHGVPYVFVPERLGVARGMPTAFSAELPELQKSSLVPPELPFVWPSGDGDIRGEAISPIYASAPAAARRDRRLYVFLALIDALRVGQARERNAAAQMLKSELRVGSGHDESEHRAA